MNFALGETIDQLRDMVYKFAHAEILPRAAEIDKNKNNSKKKHFFMIVLMKYMIINSCKVSNFILYKAKMTFKSFNERFENLIERFTSMLIVMTC